MKDGLIGSTNDLSQKTVWLLWFGSGGWRDIGGFGPWGEQVARGWIGGVFLPRWQEAPHD